MFNFEIINLPENIQVDKKIIKSIFKFVDSFENKLQNGTLNLVFVSSEEIRELNHKYRKIDSATDVLSFHYYEDFSDFKKGDIVGELVFCVEKIISQGEEEGIGSEKEFYKLLIHSILHILGYDHENDADYKVMHGKEVEIWNEIIV